MGLFIHYIPKQNRRTLYLFADYWETNVEMNKIGILTTVLCFLIKSLNKIGDLVNILKPQKEKEKDLGWGLGKMVKINPKRLAKYTQSY